MDAVQDASHGTGDRDGAVVVDDGEAALDGAFESRPARGAVRGAQSVAVPRREIARVTFTVRGRASGRVRAYLLRRPVRERAAALRVRVREPGVRGETVLRLPAALSESANSSGRLLGEFATHVGEPLVVIIEAQPGAGALAVDALELVPVR